jgi:chemotaxis family two-component system sensor kinase Cph1
VTPAIPVERISSKAMSTDAFSSDRPGHRSAHRSAHRPTTTAPDAAACADEPIRIPGSIQPHGALLVLEPASLRVLQASANVEAMLGVRFAPGAQVTLDAIAGAHAARLPADLRRWLKSVDESAFLRTATLAGRAMQVIGHRTSQGVILEFEDAPRDESETLEALYPRLGRFVDAIGLLTETGELARLAARNIREITGFNRVLVYSFDEDWHGTVIAEDGDGTLPSYLGLRFPATDIPAQARDLYRLNRLRLISDAAYLPCPIVPAASPVDGGALDLSLTGLRSVSPIHLEYMRNMETASSMSISLLVDGKLWGLISCHHRAPRWVNAQLRSACDFLGQTLSLQIGARARGLYASERIELGQRQAELLARLAQAESFDAGLVANPALWLGLTGAAGAAIVLDGDIRTAGRTPDDAALRALAAWLQAEGHAGGIFATQALAEHWPGAADLGEIASGLVAASISQIHPSYLMWFRPELVHTVSWGGDPAKPMRPGADRRLHPRHSFEEWKETVRGRSATWSAAALDGVADFRNAIVNFVLKEAERRAALSEELERSNRELESFSYSVSHDLRAPFRHIVGYAELLSEREGALDATSRHYLDSIVEAALSAGRLVDDLLNFSQLGRTSLMTTPVDMKKLVEEIRRSLAHETGGRTVDWRISDLPAAWGDGALLRQALFNLVGNALKYSRGRAPAVVEIQGELRGGETVYAVRDNGIGFDMAYVGKLFGVFQRLHRSEDFEGTGIGLALTKRILDRHGGWVRAEGAPDLGATFTFGLPARHAQPEKEIPLG